jgi:hypothetical protein
MANDVQKAYDTLPPHIKGKVNVRRNKPFWLYVHGEPRIGKSSWFHPFIINELVREVGLSSIYQDPANYTCFRDCGSEFWDSYHSQPVLAYNDLFQMYTNEESMHKAIKRLRRLLMIIHMN